MAAEGKVAKDAKPFLNALKTTGSQPVAAAEGAGTDVGNPVAQRQFIRKVMRRLADTKDPKKLDEALAYIDSLNQSQSPLAAAAIDGILDAKQEILPATKPDAVLAKLQKSPDKNLADRANRLAALWGNTGAAEAIVGIITDPKRNDDDRILAVRTAAQLKTEKCKQALMTALSAKGSERLKLEIVRALGELGGEDTANAVLKEWKSFSPDARRSISEIMASRLQWAIRLMYGVQGKTVDLTEIPITAVRTMWRHDDSRLVRLLTTHIGPFRESSQEKLQLIAQKKDVVLNGPVNLAAGQEVFARTCQVCHTLYGAGSYVGPDLTGVGRSSIDALLAHVIDPSQIIGKGYENTIIETKDDQLLTGRLVEENEDQVKLLAQGAVEHAVRRKDIKKLRTENLSVMPEGLEDMPEQDFRNLIWYVFGHPDDERVKRLMVERREKELVVKAKLPGSERMVELLTYVIDPTLRPYMHPVRDPSATVVLTEDRPSDHPWQHGIFTGLHKVNGLDFWSESKGEKSGRQHFVKLLDLQETMERVSFRSLSEWRDASGNVVLEEEQEVAVHAIDSSDLYRIDFEWLLRAKDKPVTVGRHDYGGFSVRMKTTPQHAHLNANGQLSMDNAPQSSPWTNVSNPYNNQWFGIAILDHPQNFGFPSTWRVDGQGLINPSPSLKGDWQIDANKERIFNYRLIIHRGKGDPKFLSDEHARWAPPVSKTPVTAAPPPN
jgi:putative heme-binding domain-containing protein